MTEWLLFLLAQHARYVASETTSMSKPTGNRHHPVGGLVWNSGRLSSPETPPPPSLGSCIAQRLLLPLPFLLRLTRTT